ncbi:MAG: aminodeoxychorismate synthase component I [Candidatus Aquicultor sp.]
MTSEATLLVKELRHIEDPSEALQGFLNDHMPFLLESPLLMDRYGRYSILGSNPTISLQSKGSITIVNKAGHTIPITTSDPLTAVDEVLRSFGTLEPGEFSWLPFTGGAVGYFGYDLNRRIERIPDIAEDDQNIPDIYLGFYTEAIIIDHLDKKTYAIAYIPADDTESLAKAQSSLDLLIDKTTKLRDESQNAAGNSVTTAALHKENHGVAANLSSNFTREQYKQAIDKAKEYISAGDIFQVNLAQRFTADLYVDHYTLYKLLREANPAPFAAYLGYGDFSILSSSPERFMFVNDRYVETRPIKGTRPRYKDISKDKAAVNELLASEKDSAEHVMIVDVKRNDLGRVCEFGSVEVPDVMVVESYEAVHHLVSTVTGQLRPDIGMMDLIRASFPGGSITGAPKIRAMEIIEELEPHRRNLYTGSIGYISTNGKMDTNIVIRTITALGDKAYLQVGGGIVADSDPEEEYMETLDKGRAIFNALGLKEDLI